MVRFNDQKMKKKSSKDNLSIYKTKKRIEQEVTEVEVFVNSLMAIVA